MATRQGQSSAGGNITLLSPEQRAACERLASESGPYAHKAQALVMLDQGVTQAQAAQTCSLTPGQVRYWLAKFKKQGMQIFTVQQAENEEKKVSDDRVVCEASSVEEESSETEQKALKTKVKKKKKSKKKKKKDLDKSAKSKDKKSKKKTDKKKKKSKKDKK